MVMSRTAMKLPTTSTSTGTSQPPVFAGELDPPGLSGAAGEAGGDAGGGVAASVVGARTAGVGEVRAVRVGFAAGGPGAGPSATAASRRCSAADRVIGSPSYSGAPILNP